jgi:ParB family chromosome partitioning protein
VLELAESIEGLGLLEPLVVDAKGRLLAGGHRLAACRLLAPQRSVRAAAREHLLALAAPRQRAALALRMEALELRLDGGGGLESDLVPVRVMDFDAAEDPDRALAVEATENGQRRDYTRAEVVQLYRRLLDAGYTDRPGKPRPGERPARPLVATVIGRSVRTVRRLLAEPAEAPHRSPAAEAHAALLELERSLDRAQEALRGLRREEPGVERLLSSLQRSALGDEVRFLREQLAAER